MKEKTKETIINALIGVCAIGGLVMVALTIYSIACWISLINTLIP